MSESKTETFENFFGFAPGSSEIGILEVAILRAKLIEVAIPFHETQAAICKLHDKYQSASTGVPDIKTMLADQKLAVELKAKKNTAATRWTDALKLASEAGYQLSNEIDEYRLETTGDM